MAALAPKAKVRSEVRTGVYTLSVVLLLSLAFVFGPALFAPERRIYRMQVGANDDLTGLRTGSSVSFGGVLRGSVLRVFAESGPNGEDGYVVELEIATDPPIYPGAAARIVTEPVSQRARIEFIEVGRPGANRDPLERGGYILYAPGRTGIEDVIGPKLDAAIHNVTARVTHFRDAIPRLRESAARFRAVRDDAAALGDAIRTDLPRLRAQAAEAADRFRALAAAFESLRARGGPLRDSFADVRADFGEGGPWARALAQGRTALEAWREARPEIDRIAERFRMLDAPAARIRRSLLAMRDQFVGLVDEAGFGELRANLSLVGTNLAYMNEHILPTLLAMLFPSESPEDRRRDALDDLDRDLLAALAEVRIAERALRDLAALIEAGEIGGERIDRLLEALDSVEAIERVLWADRFADEPR